MPSNSYNFYFKQQVRARYNKRNGFAIDVKTANPSISTGALGYQVC
jgi:hypothetical protein